MSWLFIWFFFWSSGFTQNFFHNSSNKVTYNTKRVKSFSRSPLSSFVSSNINTSRNPLKNNFLLVCINFMYQLGDLKSTNNGCKYRSSDLFHTSNKEDKNTATESCISSAITITQQCQKHICQSWTGCAKRGHESWTGTSTESMRFLLDLPPMQTRQRVSSVLFRCRVQLN